MWRYKTSSHEVITFLNWIHERRSDKVSTSAKVWTHSAMHSDRLFEVNGVRVLPYTFIFSDGDSIPWFDSLRHGFWCRIVMLCQFIVFGIPIGIVQRRRFRRKCWSLESIAVSLVNGVRHALKKVCSSEDFFAFSGGIRFIQDYSLMVWYHAGFHSYAVIWIQ